MAALLLPLSLLGLRAGPLTCPAPRVAPRAIALAMGISDGGAMKATLEEAKVEEAQSAEEAAEAAGAEARANIDATRADAKSAAAALRAELEGAGEDHAVARVLAKRGSAPAKGKLTKELRKPPGTIAVIPYGAPIESVSQGGYDLNDPVYLSAQFRDGAATAAMVDMRSAVRLSAAAVRLTAEEQETARGDFPGPLPVLVRDDFVDEVQLARAKAEGASAVMLELGLNGEEQTGALMAAATELGLEPLVRVGDEAELQAALRLEAACVVFGDMGLERAGALRELLPEGVTSVCDVVLPEAVRDTWRVRDAGFNAAVIGLPLLKMCVRERAPPTAVLKAMLSKGSVKFGLGMQLGRLEGAKEELGQMAM